MGKKMKAMSSILLAFFMLSACGTNLDEQVMEDMNEATQKNTTLENATYSQSMLTN